MKNDYFINQHRKTVLIELDNWHQTVISLQQLKKAKRFPGRWRAYHSKDKIYVGGQIWTNGKAKTVYLHRWLTDCPDDFVVDHINGNSLNNIHTNLRIVTQAENLQNLHAAQSNSKSGVRNVFFDKYFKKWVAEVVVNGKAVYKKRFKFQEDAEVAAAMARAKYQPFSPEGTAIRKVIEKDDTLLDFVQYDLNFKGEE